MAVRGDLSGSLSGGAHDSSSSLFTDTTRPRTLATMMAKAATGASQSGSASSIIKAPAFPSPVRLPAEPTSSLLARWRHARTGIRNVWLVGVCLLVVLFSGLGFVTHALAQQPTWSATTGSAGRDALLAYNQAQMASSYDQFSNLGQGPTATPVPPTPTATPKPPAPPPPVYSGPTVNTVGQPCHSDNLWAPNIGNWTAPPDCYATIYSPNPSAYPPTIGAFGYCNWWVNVLNPSEPNLLYGSQYRRGSTPIPGAAIYFSGLVQGASGAGHFAQVVAIAPDHYWMLITEMNFGWRGGGFGKVDYRYAHVGAGVTFIYPK